MYFARGDAKLASVRRTRFFLLLILVICFVPSGLSHSDILWRRPEQREGKRAFGVQLLGRKVNGTMSSNRPASMAVFSWARRTKGGNGRAGIWDIFCLFGY